MWNTPSSIPKLKFGHVGLFGSYLDNSETSKMENNATVPSRLQQPDRVNGPDGVISSPSLKQVIQPLPTPDSDVALSPIERSSVSSADVGVAIDNDAGDETADYEITQFDWEKNLDPTSHTNTGAGLTQPLFSSSIREMCSYVDTTVCLQDMTAQKMIGQEEMEDYKTAPIFSSAVGTFLEASSAGEIQPSSPYAQYGLIGLRTSVSSPVEGAPSLSRESADLEDNLILANMDVPWSAFICGSQGAGKSHTLSCLLENALVGGSQISQLPNPLAAMVFHYDLYTNASCSQVCEAAYLCSSGIPVTVLVSPSNIWAMTKLYTNLPGLPANAPKPKVLPLYLSESLLDISTMLKLMAIDPSAESVPFYMETVMSILREMAMEGKGAGAFSYTEFRHRIDSVKWLQGQVSALNLRLQLLDSFLQPTQFTKTTRPASAKENIWAFDAGAMTIVDLSDPFISSSDACSLFSICLSLFLEDRAKCGRVVALDEAHKFLLQSGAARALTADLTSVIRQQRHTGTRVLVATQEPTLAPEIIDLANVTFVHRFLSPAWYEVLRRHLAGANKNDAVRGRASLFETIVSLQTGEALLFCPTALVSIETNLAGTRGVEKLNNGYMRIKIRQRLTADGGKSILASEKTVTPDVSGPQLIPMHVVVNPAVPIGKNRGNMKNPGYSSPAQPVHVPTPTALQPAITANIPAQPVPATLKPATFQPSINRPPASAFKSYKDRIEHEARFQMRKNFVHLNWREESDIQWDYFIKDVEVALKLKIGTMSRSENKQWLTTLKGGAKNEQHNLRKKKK